MGWLSDHTVSLLFLGAGSEVFKALSSSWYRELNENWQSRSFEKLKPQGLNILRPADIEVTGFFLTLFKVSIKMAMDMQNSAKIDLKVGRNTI